MRPELSALGVEAPRALGTQLDPPARQWAILLEDLTERGATFPNALGGLPLPALEALLADLAAMHAHYWQSGRFGGELGWLPTVRAGGAADVFETLGFGLVRDHISRHAFVRALLAPLGLSTEQLWEGVAAANAALEAPPVTLCHGDCHVQNTYLLAGGRRAGLYDWQLCLRASWARDVSYLIGTCLPTEARRQHEGALLRGYLRALADAGCAAPPTIADAERLYAQGMAWGLVLGWLICPPNNYGEAIFSANVRRLVAACSDLHTFALLGVHPAAPREPAPR